MSQHAPGPWRLGAMDLYEAGEGDKQGIAIVATDGSIICDNQTYYPKPLDPANAPLIAAAPTLSDAIMDRIVHNAYRLELKGESMRKQKSLTHSGHKEV